MKPRIFNIKINTYSGVLDIDINASDEDDAWNQLREETTIQKVEA